MKVTEVTAQKNNKHRVSVFVDNEYAFSLDETDAVMLKIKPGRELTEADMTRCIMECNYTKARDYSLNILSARPMTQKQLSDKLKEKGYDEAVVTEVKNELILLGYLNDYDYAELFLEHCISKMWGKKKIRYEMKQKGISDEIIKDILEDYDSADFCDEMAEMIISKYGSCELKDMKTKARVIRYFSSKGFDFSDIDRALRRAAEIAEDEVCEDE